MSTKIEKSGNKKPSTGQSAPPPSQICRQLERLTLLERGRQVEIQTLWKAQIRSKEIDLSTVERYFDMLEVSEPPSIIAIEDTGANKLFIADGHHRAAAADKAGRKTILADVYAGTRQDARLVGLEMNRGGLALSLGEKKQLLDEVLDFMPGKFTEIDLAAMTGFERHTVARRVKEKAAGDFGAVISRTRRIKSDEEQKTAAIQAIIRLEERFNGGVILKAIESLPYHLHQGVINSLGKSPA